MRSLFSFLGLGSRDTIIDFFVVYSSTKPMFYFILDFVQFLPSSSERSFPQLNKFLGRGKNTPSFKIYYAAVCFSLEAEGKNCTKSSYHDKVNITFCTAHFLIDVILLDLAIKYLSFLSGRD